MEFIAPDSVGRGLAPAVKNLPSRGGGKNLLIFDGGVKNAGVFKAFHPSVILPKVGNMPAPLKGELIGGGGATRSESIMIDCRGQSHLYKSSPRRTMGVTVDRETIFYARVSAFRFSIVCGKGRCLEKCAGKDRNFYIFHLKIFRLWVTITQ